MFDFFFYILVNNTNPAEWLLGCSAWLLGDFFVKSYGSWNVHVFFML